MLILDLFKGTAISEVENFPEVIVYLTSSIFTILTLCQKREIEDLRQLEARTALISAC